MKKTFLLWAAAVIAAGTITSCAYDPYYAGGYYNPGYAGTGYGYGSTDYGYGGTGYGYGVGYGYGGPGFSTSFFVSTGDPRWGYDPYCYSYYDYYRRCYYDPYLYGYYPMGYRPYSVVGCPHPYGWRPGHGRCQPPHLVRNTALRNYQNRAGAYRNSNYGWAHQVRLPSYSNPRHNGNRFNYGNPGHSNSNWTSRPNGHYPSGLTQHQGTTSSNWRPQGHQASSGPYSQHNYSQGRSKFSGGGYNFSGGSNVRSGGSSGSSHNFSSGSGYSGSSRSFSGGSSVRSGGYSGGSHNFSGGSNVRSGGGSGGGNHGNANSSKGDRRRDR